MHKKLTLACSFVLIISIFSCRYDESKEIENHANTVEPVIRISSNRPNLNISFLLDLSDRIANDGNKTTAMNNFRKDMGYINSVTKSFEIHLRNKKSRQINDKIQVFLSPEPSDNELNQKIDYLKLEFDRGNSTKANILETSVKYDSIISLIYEQAIKDNYYPGSDIWRFFRKNVKDFCIRDDYRNILIILTDGYMYHEDTELIDNNLSSYLTNSYIKRKGLNTPDWKNKIDTEEFGYIPATKGLDSLEVLVLGIDPVNNNIIEEEIIYEYWSKWFEKMDVKRSQIKSAELPSNLDTIIKDFILSD